MAVGGETVAESGPGLLLLVGVGAADDGSEVARLAEKIVHLRIFEDADGRLGATIHRSAFREHMEVDLVNDGPVTLVLEA